VAVKCARERPMPLVCTPCSTGRCRTCTDWGPAKDSRSMSRSRATLVMPSVRLSPRPTRGGHSRAASAVTGAVEPPALDSALPVTARCPSSGEAVRDKVRGARRDRRPGALRAHRAGVRHAPPLSMPSHAARLSSVRLSLHAVPRGMLPPAVLPSSCLLPRGAARGGCLRRERSRRRDPDGPGGQRATGAECLDRPLWGARSSNEPRPHPLASPLAFGGGESRLVDP
jgi:hypothetical protein